MDSIFFIFSFLSICELKDPNQNYIEYTILKAILENNNEGNSDKKKEGIENDIVKRLEPLLYDGNFTKNFKLVSMTRFSFYKANIKKCNDDYNTFNNQSKCYKAYYKNSDNSLIYDSKYEKMNASKSVDYFIYSSVNNDTDFNYVKIFNETRLKAYSDSVYRGFDMQNYEVENTKIKGNYGTYDGRNSADLFIPLNLINKEVLILILDMSKDSFLDFSNQSQKAIVVDFTLYSIFSKKYFYIYLLYENSISVETSKPDISIIPFYPDLKQTENGKLIFILDILRLIFIIIFFIIRVKEVYDELMLNYELQKHQKLARSGLSIIFSADLILDLGLIVIYISDFVLIIYIIKQKVESLQLFLVQKIVMSK